MFESIKKNFLVVILVLGAVSIGFADTAFSEQYQSPLSSDFEVSEKLRPRVDFWKLIFTQYGKSHRVFHHRKYPQIVYSVLDFSDYEEKLSGKRLVRQQRKEIKAEKLRIKRALKSLASGKQASNSFEERLESLFEALPGNRRKKFKAASEEGLIREQRGVKERFEQGLIRSGRYLYAIEEIFRVEGLPIEIGRLPLVESSFDYEAYSSKGAAGIWQFVRSTGKRYMRINASIDERRDPILATRAAARYLKHAYAKLGEWPLALTSYNHGLSGVLRAVKQTGSKDLSVIIERYKGRTFGFASSNFYTEFVAALEIERDVQRYFPGLVRESPVTFDEVKLGRSIFFRDLLRYGKMSSDVGKSLNRSFRNSVLKNRVRIPRGFLAKVPRGHGSHVLASVANSEIFPLSGALVMAASLKQRGARASGTRYRVKRGDTVGGIARRHGVSTRELMAANGLRNARKLQAGKKIVIPGGGEQPKKTSSRKRTPKQKATVVAYVIKPGDTLDGVAAKFSVSKRKLMHANRISNANRINSGQVLRIPGGAESSSAPKATQASVVGDTPAKRKSSQTHLVRSGDTISEIAREYSVSSSRLMAANGITNPGRLRAGKKLVIPNGRSSAKPRAGKVYKVAPGDNLSSISKKTKVSVKTLKKRNPGVGDLLYPGQKLVLE